MNTPINSLIFLQFAKAPSARVKTRLATALAVEQRIDLHTRMLEHTFVQLRESRLAPVELWVDEDTTYFYQGELFSSFPVYRQQGFTLGDRLFHALSNTLAKVDAVMVVGSDCPFITAEYLNQAIEALGESSVVIGPATDGGYVLLGARKIHTAIFENIEWGSDKVLTQTVSALGRLRWSYRLLNPLPDIDRPEDLQLLDDPKFDVALREYAKFKL